MAKEPHADKIYQLQVVRDRASLAAALDEFAPDDAYFPSSSPIYLQVIPKVIREQTVLSKINVLVPNLSKIYVIDYLHLNYDAIMTTSSQGVSLRTIFESGAVLKVFFDGRRVSDGRYFGDIQNIQEIQILELATRPDDPDRTRLSDLDSLIKEHSITIPKWECGRCTEIVGFDDKLLALPALREIYMDRLLNMGPKERFWKNLIFQATLSRLHGGVYGGQRSPWNHAMIETGLQIAESKTHLMGFKGEHIVPRWRRPSKQHLRFNLNLSV